VPRGSAQDRLIGGLECIVLGSGPPLVMLPGLAPENGRPTARPIRNGEVQAMARYARSHTVYWVGRPTGLTRGTSFAQLTATTAAALRAEFGAPVRVAGISTGGSIAQQLAAEHPDCVERLVLVSTGCRLGVHAAATQRALIGIAARGRTRPMMAAVAWDLVPPWRGRTPAAALAYLAGPRLYPRARDLTDLLVTLEAEDAFDLRWLPPITAPTLIVNGGRDRFYELAVVEETARLIPHSRLALYPARGHVTVSTDRRAIAEIRAFLA
jgi:pimeloyl-ACP methyl ester carboxylesterase